MRLAALGVLTTGLAILAVAFGGSGCNDTAPDPLGSPGAIIVLTALDNRFDPATLSARVGEVVAITVRNEGFAVHNVRILSVDSEGREYGSKQTLSPGEEDTFKFRFNAPGTYEFQ
ncbi:MAG: cupredoxin domain-containing protein, partial [Dehalococcoidia bacterium]